MRAFDGLFFFQGGGKFGEERRMRGAAGEDQFFARPREPYVKEAALFFDVRLVGEERQRFFSQSAEEHDGKFQSLCAVQRR